MDTGVPNNIAKLRKQHGLSQDELAGKLRLSVTQLSRLERGLSSMTQVRMKAIAKVMGVEPHDLFAPSKARWELDLEVMRKIIVQLDEMLARMEIAPTPQQRADLTVELYRLETDGVAIEDMADLKIDLSKYEGMLRSIRR